MQTHPLANDTQRNSKTLIPLSGTQWYRDRSTGVRRPSRRTVYPPLPISPFGHDLLHDDLRLVVQRYQHGSQQTNPFAQLSDPGPGVRPVQQDHDQGLRDGLRGEEGSEEGGEGGGRLGEEICGDAGEDVCFASV